MALKVCQRHNPEEVWRPRISFVDQRNLLNNKVTVAFVKPSRTLGANPDDLAPGSPLVTSPTKEVVSDSPRFEHAYIPGDVLRHLRDYHSQMTSHVSLTSACAEDDVLSERSYNNNTPGTTPRTYILSHMAKHKTSWVENALQNRVQPARRKSSILIKGKNQNSFETPFEKSKKSKDTCTKGVRDGRRFDLLPISKYLSKFQKEAFVTKPQVRRLPLVRISSVHRSPTLPPSTSRVSCSPQGPQHRRGTTFFTERDMFQPRETRSLPTRGEATFVDIREQLPSLYKKQYNAPVVKMGREQKLWTRRVILPTVT